MVPTRYTDVMVRQMDQAARSIGFTRAQLVRQAVREYLRTVQVAR